MVGVRPRSVARAIYASFANSEAQVLRIRLNDRQGWTWSKDLELVRLCALLVRLDSRARQALAV